MPGSGDWDTPAPVAPVLIYPASQWAQGVDIAACAAVAPVLTLTNVTANLVRIYPFYLPEKIKIVKFWWYNGSTVTGSTTVDVGVYSGDITTPALIDHGTATQATISVLQEIAAVNAAVLGRGWYYMAHVSGSTTTTYASHTLTAPLCKMMGLAQHAAGSAVLPATITPATYVAGSAFIFGLSARSLVA